jgi:hypothetical protein
MLRSKAHLGMLAYTQVPGKQKVKEWHAGRHAPVVPADLHARVAAVLDQRHQAKRKPPTPGTEAMLTGMLLCGCGHAMTRSPKGQAPTCSGPAATPQRNLGAPPARRPA